MKVKAERYGFDGEALRVNSRRYRDCEACGCEADVLGGALRRGTVDRRLACRCGRRWRQIITD